MRPHLLPLFIASIIVALYPLQPAAAAMTRQNIPYFQEGDLTLELSVYQPKFQTGLRPAVVMYHGGGWRKGAPSQFAHLANYLTQHDIIVISVDYRLIGDKTSNVGDCALDAIRAYDWVCKNAESIGVDPEKIAIGGGSAGGQLALYVTLVDAAKYTEITGSIRRAPLGFLGLNPVVDTNRLAFAKTFEAYGNDLNPIELITHEGRPLYGIIAHGEADNVVPLESVLRFKSLVSLQGGDLQVRAYPNEGHGFFNARADRETLLKEIYSDIYPFLAHIFGLE